jgi:RTX calcium-binding nonapeptide repeat (4 copies)
MSWSSATRRRERVEVVVRGLSKVLVALSLLGGIASLESTPAGAETAALEFTSRSPAPGTSFAALAPHGPEGPPDQNNGLEGTAPFDGGVYIAYCARPGAPYGRRARAAGTSEAGWPAKECLKMDKGPAGRQHTLVGLNGVHNWLLGGYGNDTIIGGNHGDVIWGDYHPSGAPRSQTVTIHAGNGRNVIYANDTHNYVWTGTNPNTVVHAHVSGISGTIHCQASGIIVFLSTVSERHFKLDGCRHISHLSVGY